MSYTSSTRVINLIGQSGVDLRTDDGSQSTYLAEAVAFGTNQVDFYCSRYSETELAASAWAQDAATYAAAMELCTRRLNEVPASIQKMWDEVFLPQLTKVQEGKAQVPRAATSRNPVSVTNYAADLRRLNNQVRVDPSRSTGVADEYTRPKDETAPDQR